MIAHRCGGCQQEKKSPRPGEVLYIKIDKNSNGYFIFARGGKGCQGVLFGGGGVLFLAGVGGVRVLQNAHFGGVVRGVLRNRMRILAFWTIWARGQKVPYYPPPPPPRPPRGRMHPLQQGGRGEKI